MSETRLAVMLLQAAYSQLDDKNIIAIYPEDLADVVFRQFDQAGVTPALLAWAARLELRQLARHVCARHPKMAQSDADAQFDELLDLRRRYPAMRCDDCGLLRHAYVLRGGMSYWERKAVSSRLRSEGNAKLFHGDALDTETDLLVRSGQLIIGPKPVELKFREADKKEGLPWSGLSRSNEEGTLIRREPNFWSKADYDLNYTSYKRAEIANGTTASALAVECCMRYGEDPIMLTEEDPNELWVEEEATV
jgi:hypothetical protein